MDIALIMAASLTTHPKSCKLFGHMDRVMGDMQDGIDPTASGVEPAETDNGPATDEDGSIEDGLDPLAARRLALEAMLCMLEDALQGTRMPPPWLPPWYAWLIVALVRFRDRQRWALGCLPRRVIDRKYHEPECVPGHPDWALQMSGLYVCMRCATTGERIVLPVDDGCYSGPGEIGAETVCPHAFATWVKSLAVGGGSGQEARADEADDWPERFVAHVLPPERLPEARLWRWVPSHTMISSMVYLLGDDGLLTREGWTSGYWFSPELETFAPAVAAEDFSSSEVCARWASHAGDVEVDGARAGVTVETLIMAHQEWIHRTVRRGGPLGVGRLLPLIVMYLDGSELVWSCDTLLENARLDADDVLEFLLLRPKLPICRGVGRLLQRLAAEWLYLRTAALAIEYLMWRRCELALAAERFATFAALAVVEAESDPRRTSYLKSYVQIALDWFPGDAMWLVRKALRGHDDYDVRDVASALVALDLPWCARELNAAYRETPPHADLLREALGLTSHRPADILPFVGKSRIATLAAWYREHRRRTYPPHFGNDDRSSELPR